MNESFSSNGLWEGRFAHTNPVTPNSGMHGSNMLQQGTVFCADYRNIDIDDINLYADVDQTSGEEASRAAVLRGLITQQQRIVGRYGSHGRHRSGFTLQSRTGGKNALSKAQIAAAKFFDNIMEVWNLSHGDMAVLLGQDDLDSDEQHEYVQSLLAGNFLFRGRDVKDRMAQLLQIRRVLSSLFRDGQVENKWLRKPQKVLDGKSPMKLMLDGHMEGLSLAREFVESVAGL